MTITGSKSLLDQLFTPRQIAQRGILSLVRQWQERNAGKLEYYRIGRKILYSETHISNYLRSCESTESRRVKSR